MGLLSSKLRSWSDNRGRSGLTYWCQGCQTCHQITTQGGPPGQNWTWNGDVNKPVFGPSVLTRSGHYMDSHKPGDDCWCTFNEKHPEDERDFECQQCHTWVGCNGAKPGEVYFLGDCSHELKGKILPFPDLPEYMQRNE
ncbi:hypothetical protein [Burkholderia phage FLC6]|nr:hypothetical protein [Burkholderia phage FLC6]BDD79466.1 hypothetical protein [Burkholderia phage FLC8]